MKDEDIITLAKSFLDICWYAGYTRVCWKADENNDNWLLACSIVILSYLKGGILIYGAYDMGVKKKHGNMKRFQGYDPIEGKTLYL